MSATDAEKSTRRRRRGENDDAEAQPEAVADTPLPNPSPSPAVGTQDSAAFPTLAADSAPPLPPPAQQAPARPPPLQIQSGFETPTLAGPQPVALLAALDDAQYPGLRRGEVDEKDLVQPVGDSFHGLVPESTKNKSKGDDRSRQTVDLFVQQPNTHFKKVRNSEQQGAQKQLLSMASSVLTRAGDVRGSQRRARKVPFLAGWRVTAFDQEALKLDLTKMGDARIFELMIYGEQSRAGTAMVLFALQGLLAGICLLSLAILGLAGPGANGETDPSMGMEPSLGRLIMVFVEASLVGTSLRWLKAVHYTRASNWMGDEKRADRTHLLSCGLASICYAGSFLCCLLRGRSEALAVAFPDNPPVEFIDGTGKLLASMRALLGFLGFLPAVRDLQLELINGPGGLAPPSALVDMHGTATL